MEIKDSVIVVTGASSGIGKAAAIHLGQRGARVALLARSTEKLRNVQGEIPDSLLVSVDVTDFPAFKNALHTVHDHYKSVNVLINNAGRAYEAALMDIDVEKMDELYALNLVAPIVGMQTVIPWMREQGAGSIINISSGTSFMAIPSYGVYSSSKRALNEISLTARAELEAEKISVSTVYPVMTATDFGYNKIVSGSPRTHPTDYAKGDPPEHIAQLIAQAIEEEGAEYFANDQLRARARTNQ